MTTAYTYRIRQNIRGEKLSRFINNMHYVGKTFAVCSLEASARLCNADFRPSYRPAFFREESSIKYAFFHPRIVLSFSEFSGKSFKNCLTACINNSVINGISCYNGLLFKQNLQTYKDDAWQDHPKQLSLPCWPPLWPVRTTQMLIQRTRRVRQRWTTFLDLKIL